MYLSLSLIACLICSSFSVKSDLGYFWQITDVHFDPTYKVNGAHQSCQQAIEGETATNFKFGDYLCDSPYALVTSAIDTMKDNTPDDLDFILWTGDSIPHVDDEMLSPTKDYEIIGNVTRSLRRAFPGVPIHPSIGNHDHFPHSQVPIGNSSDYYTSLATRSEWNTLLSQSTLKQFSYCGFYSIRTEDNVELISLNTILWYDYNNVTENMIDPCKQLNWLENKLADAASQDRQVIIFGHVPPGIMARSESVIWYREHYNMHFNSILKKYSKSISAAIFGHEHTDAFRVIESGDDDEAHGSLMFMAPAVTPWKSTLAVVGANNPAVRLYSYNRTTGAIIDYVQYFMDLKLSTKAERAIWGVEYSSKSLFGELTAKNMHSYLTIMLINSTVFGEYFLYNSVSQTGYNNDVCDFSCRMQHYCAAWYIDHSEYNECLKIPAVVAKLALYAIILIVIASLIILSCCIGCVCFCLCRRSGNRSERLRLVAEA